MGEYTYSPWKMQSISIQVTDIWATPVKQVFMVIYRDDDFQDLERHKLRFTKYELRFYKTQTTHILLETCSDKKGETNGKRNYWKD